MLFILFIYKKYHLSFIILSIYHFVYSQILLIYYLFILSIYHSVHLQISTINCFVYFPILPLLQFSFRSDHSLFVLSTYHLLFRIFTNSTAVLGIGVLGLGGLGVEGARSSLAPSPPTGSASGGLMSHLPKGCGLAFCGSSCKV